MKRDEQQRQNAQQPKKKTQRGRDRKKQTINRIQKDGKKKKGRARDKVLAAPAAFVFPGIEEEDAGGGRGKRKQI